MADVMDWSVIDIFKCFFLKKKDLLQFLKEEKPDFHISISWKKILMTDLNRLFDPPGHDRIDGHYFHIGYPDNKNLVQH